MTFEDTLKQELEQLSTDVVGGPDLDRAIETGRRRRRNRHLAVAGGSACVAALVAAAAFTLAPSDGKPDGRVEQLQPAASGPQQDARQHTQPRTFASHDYVAGTQVDEALQAAVAPNLPTGLVSSDVYASDWTRDTPLPAAQAENATDWQLYYTTGGIDTVRIVVGLPVPYEGDTASCPPQADGCQQQTLADGSTVVTQLYGTGSTFYRTVVVERPDGKSVVASDIVAATTPDEAKQGWTLNNAQLQALATSEGLDFPDPVVTPPSHR